MVFFVFFLICFKIKNTYIDYVSFNHKNRISKYFIHSVRFWSCVMYDGSVLRTNAKTEGSLAASLSFDTHIQCLSVRLCNRKMSRVFKACV